MEKKDNQSKQYFIPTKESHWDDETGTIKQEIVQVPVTEEFFKSFYRPINAHRKRMQEHGRCTCPANRRTLCDTNCEECPYKAAGDSMDSLDATVSGKDGDEMDKYSAIPSAQNIEADFIRNDEIARLKERVMQLMPIAFEIGRLREEGLSDSAISERIGVPRTTFLSQLNKLKDALRDDFPEWIR